MCDVVNSRDKNQNSLIKDLKETVAHINRKYKGEILSPLTITLGDEFQGVLNHFSTAIKIIIEIEEYVIKNKFDFKLRYILNTGNIETKINTKVAYEMLGPGLADTRNKLNELKSSDNRINFFIEEDILCSVINNSFVVFDSIINKWDIENDFEIASNFIEFRDYKIVSEKLSRNRSLLWKREKTLNIKSYLAIREVLFSLTKIKFE